MNVPDEEYLKIAVEKVAKLLPGLTGLLQKVLTLLRDIVCYILRIIRWGKYCNNSFYCVLYLSNVTRRLCCVCNRQTKLLKGESFDGRESCRGSVLRPSVSKSFSFGGYTRGMLSRGDSVTSTHSAGARLMKQGSCSVLYEYTLL